MGCARAASGAADGADADAILGADDAGAAVGHEDQEAVQGQVTNGNARDAVTDRATADEYPLSDGEAHIYPHVHEDSYLTDALGEPHRQGNAHPDDHRHAGLADGQRGGHTNACPDRFAQFPDATLTPALSHRGDVRGWGDGGGTWPVGGRGTGPRHARRGGSADAACVGEVG
jgi:hypothetical protein